VTRPIGIARRACADNAETYWLLTGDETDVIALAALRLLSQPIDAHTHALAAKLWRRFGGPGEVPARREGEWR
jgi:hypothetical protein